MLDFRHDFATLWFPVVGTENVVDADVEMVVVVTDAGAVACFAVAVGEVLRDGVTAVGNGSVVEVAAEDDAFPFVFVEEIDECIDLRHASDGAVGQFFGDSLGIFGGEVARIVTFDDFVEIFAVIDGKHGRCQMVIDDDDRVAVDVEEDGGGMSAFFLFQRHVLALDNGVAAQRCDVVGAAAAIF